MPKNQSLASSFKARSHLTVTNFFGGLNEDPNYAALDDNEFSVLENMYWKERTLASRPGTEHYNPSAANGGAVCTGLFDFTRTAGASSTVVAVFGNKIMQDQYIAGSTSASYWDTATWGSSVWTREWVDITGSVTITAGQNNVFTHTVFKDILIITNGVDVPIKWSGSGNAAILGGSPPTAPYIASKWGRVFMAGMSSDRGIIQYSAVNNHESWAAGDQLRIFVAGDEWITGLGNFKNFLLVMTNKQIYSVTANEGEGIYLQPLNVDKNNPIQVGVAHQRAFANVGGEAVFLDYEGRVRSLQATIQYGSLAEASLSRKISRVSLKNLNLARIPYAVAQYFPSEDWVVFAVSISNATKNTLLLVLDMKDASIALDPIRAKPKWVRFTGLTVNAMATHTASGLPYLYFGDHSGYISRFNDSVLNDNGLPFLKIAKTKWFDFGSPHMVKSLRTFAIEAEQNNSTLTINHYFDYIQTASSALSLSSAGSTADALWDSAVWNTAVWQGEIIKADWRCTGRGSVMQTEFKNGLAGERFGILRYDYGTMEIGER